MIANLIFRTRSEILEYRTRMFMERNRQLPGIKGRNVYSPSSSPFAADQSTDVNHEEQSMIMEPRAEEVIEERFVQNDLEIEQYDDEEEEDQEYEDVEDEISVDTRLAKEDEEVEVCIELEKENNPPGADPAALLTPLTLELPCGDCRQPMSIQPSASFGQYPRKRRSIDEDFQSQSQQPCDDASPWPCKRASPEPVLPGDSVTLAPAGNSSISTLSDSFQKSISFQLPCGMAVEQSAFMAPGRQQEMLVQLHSLGQQQRLAMAAS